MTDLAKSLCMFIASLGVATAGYAQSTVGELLEKGGKRLAKDDIQAMFPYRVQAQWPNRQGEEDLVLSQDGKISGSGFHFASKTRATAEGSWKLEEDGKLCASKKFIEWGTSTNQCWYLFELGKEYFAGYKSEPDGKVAKTGPITRLATETK